MLRKTIVLICLGVLIGGGCANKAVTTTSSRAADKEPTGGDAISRMAVSPQMAVSTNFMGKVSASAGSRYLLVRQKLVVVVPGAELAKSGEAVIAISFRRRGRGT
jgi:hypothetical protein